MEINSYVLRLQERIVELKRERDEFEKWLEEAVEITALNAPINSEQRQIDKIPDGNPASKYCGVPFSKIPRVKLYGLIERSLSPAQF